MIRGPWFSMGTDEGRSRIIVTCLMLLTVGALTVALAVAQAFLAPTALAMLLAVTLSPIRLWFRRRGAPEEVAAGVTVAGALALIGAAIYMLIPSYEVWRYKGPEISREIGAMLSEVQKVVSETVEDVKEATGVEDVGVVATGAGAEDPTQAPMANAAATAFDWLMGAPAIAASALYVTLLTFFLLAEGRLILRTLTAVFGHGFVGRLRVGRLLRGLHRDIARYFLLVSAINACLGVAVTVVFMMIGMPNAPLWGAVMALMNFMPYLGAAITNIVVFVVALFSFGSISLALLPTLSLLALNTIEGQLVTPMLVGRNFVRSTAMVFMAVAFGAWLWGAIGALLATPLLICAKAIGKRVMEPDQVQFQGRRFGERRTRSR